MNIRITNAYGPQNYDDQEKKQKFWQYLENEVLISQQNDSACMIMIDSNCWLGKNILSFDPNPQNDNGKYFAHFLEKYDNITLLNSHPSCEGQITRSHTLKDKTEKSILDFMLVCNKLLPFFQNMSIDEAKQYSLTNFQAKGPRK